MGMVKIWMELRFILEGELTESIIGLVWSSKGEESTKNVF